MSKRGTIWRKRTNNAKNHGRKRQGPRTQVDRTKGLNLAQAWNDVVAGRVN